MRLFCRSFCAALIIVSLFSCGSVPKDKVTAKDHIETQYTADPSQAVTIAVPHKKSVNFFAGVNPQAVKEVENGSPSSIKTAYALLRKEYSLYQENEKILLMTARALMSILWPSENENLDSFEVSSSNPYIGALESAKQGIYDESTGDYDFLTLVLPSLVLLTSESRSDYYALSEASLKKTLELNSESVLANYLYGVLCRRQEKYSDSVSYFEKAYEKSPDTIEIIYALGQSYLKTGKASKAFELGEKIVNKNPVYTPALKLCAEAGYSLNRLEESERYVARVLQQEPENTYYILFRARILVSRQDYIRAASLLDVYARRDSENREYLVLRAQVQKDWNKNMTGAAATIEKALSLYPDDSQIVLTAASLASETGLKINGKSAGELAALILEKDPKNLEALKIQIDELALRKKWAQAYEVSSRLLKQKNVPESAVFTHVNICLNAGRKDEAWNLSSSLYSEKPKDEEVLQNYIKVLISTGRTGEASRLISSNLQNASSKMKSFLYFERSYLESSEEAVLVDLRSSLTANPRNKDALFRLYQIYYGKKEYRKAQYYLKQVVALSPSDESLIKLNSELEVLLSK